MRRYLILIESSFAKEPLANIVRRYGADSFSIMSTNGRLTDIDRSSLSVGTDFTPEHIAYTVLSPKLIDRIKTASLQHETTLLASDYDAEGEKIALDLVELAQLKNYKRINPEHIYQHGLDYALERSTQIDQTLIRYQKSKRILDSVLGESGENRRKNESVGRVLTPLLQSISNVPLQSAVIHKQLSNDLQLIVSLHDTSPLQTKSLAYSLSTFNALEWEESGEQTYQVNTKFWTGKLALLNTAASLAIPITRAYDHYQDLYQSGLISYFRTDATTIDSATYDRIKQCSSIYGFERDSFESLQLRMEEAGRSRNIYEHAQGGHSILTPLDYSVDPYSKLTNFSERDQVYLLLLRHFIASAGQRVPVVETTYTLKSMEDNFENKLFADLMRRHQCSFKVLKRIAPNTSRFSVMYPEFKPNNYNRCSEAVSDSTSYFTVQKDLAIATRLYQLGFARPSTFSQHAKNISKHYLSESLALNRNAQQALTLAKRAAPGLADNSIYKQLEDILSEESFTIEARVAKCLTLIQWSKLSLPDSKGPLFNPEIEAILNRSQFDAPIQPPSPQEVDNDARNDITPV